ncbi:hypothetical protein [Bacillus gaemokensis]|uniref:hypothetical protein n=1 Tax=Bacillus gaemokensis TaxID=574375 RepID=UPI0012DFAC48|nr:hypothetical protein [Bacillus gaemokensis]
MRDKQDFFVWLEGNNKQVMIVESTSEQHGVDFELNDTYLKISLVCLNISHCRHEILC